jgi:hypothetical protein
MDYEKTRVPLYTRRYTVLRQNPLKTHGSNLWVRVPLCHKPRGYRYGFSETKYPRVGYPNPQVWTHGQP